MAGPIQSAIGQALGAIGGAAALGKKLYEENEGQALKEERAEEEKKAKTESKDQTVKKALQKAQDFRIESPKKYLFDEGGNLIANYSELASVMASQSLANELQARSRQKAAFERRKEAIKLRAKNFETKK